jgi:hypothetical protein
MVRKYRKSDEKAEVKHPHLPKSTVRTEDEGGDGIDALAATPGSTFMTHAPIDEPLPFSLPLYQQQ